MKIIEKSFILIIVVLSLCACWMPRYFIIFIPYLSYLLAFVMMLMGVTLKKDDLLQALGNWRFALLGTFLQFLLMPSIAYVVATVFELPIEYKLGLILVGCCPGGTASNVIVYLFKGDVSLSVLMTFMSTVLSVVLTPFLLDVYVGKQMDLPFQKIVVDILTLVITPLVLGYGIQRFFKPNILDLIEKSASMIAVLVIALIVSAIVAANVSVINTLPLILLISVVLHNGLGMLFGYGITRLFTKNKMVARTIAIEVGMQNSGLGVVLANLHFVKAAALPSAIFSFWHNVSGIMLANYWRRENTKL